jgi:hypothetical protein
MPLSAIQELLIEQTLYFRTVLGAKKQNEQYCKDSPVWEEKNLYEQVIE